MVHWYDGGMKPPRPEELDEGLQWGTGGTLFVGDKGTEKMTRVKLLWDGPNMTITNLPEANQYLRRSYREGWSL
jgi:hypothetical protein